MLMLMDPFETGQMMNTYSISDPSLPILCSPMCSVYPSLLVTLVTTNTHNMHAPSTVSTVFTPPAKFKVAEMKILQSY